MQKDHVKLSQPDQDFLITLVAKGQISARLSKRATALSKLHRGKTLWAVAQTLQVSSFSLANWRDGYRKVGLEVLYDQPRSGRPPQIDSTQRAKVTALACSSPPQGRARWTLRLLANKAVELGYCEELSHTAARRILKKMTSGRI